jgi:hypothetical protein
MAVFLEKKPTLVRNGIVEQVKQAANSLTIQEWNQVVNTLKLQANVTVEYLEKLHKALFGTYTSATTGLNEFEDEGVINTLLSILEEFNIANLQDGQFIRYDGTTEKFKATTANKVVVSQTEPNDNKSNDLWFNI